MEKIKQNSRVVRNNTMKLNSATVKTFWHLVIIICDKHLFKFKPNSNDAFFLFTFTVFSHLDQNYIENFKKKVILCTQN